jgi:hypothetical protein
MQAHFCGQTHQSDSTSTKIEREKGITTYAQRWVKCALVHEVPYVRPSEIPLGGALSRGISCAEADIDGEGAQVVVQPDGVVALGDGERREERGESAAITITATATAAAANAYAYAYSPLVGGSQPGGVAPNKTDLEKHGLAPNPAVRVRLPS